MGWHHGHKLVLEHEDRLFCLTRGGAIMKILVTEPLHDAGIAHLERNFHVDVKLSLPPASLLREVADYDALITRSGTSVQSDLLCAGKKRLKVVGRAGIGVDNIDIKAATEH